ncbi:hypothetical protein [Secundilactobacillus kimchicus]|uniref:hypothetical protein n=1 Tax=Secundilactobacillus kimchicus TaxID=528209 RepID=UPI0024A82F08|nr:hypothetical protein [Secundilactobacillus kimchicus]
MFMSTGSYSQSHIVKGVVTATSHTMLTSEKPDDFDRFDDLFEETKQKLFQKAAALAGNGVIDVSFNTEVVRMNVAPKFLVVHGFGTVITMINE